MNSSEERWLLGIWFLANKTPDIWSKGGNNGVQATKRICFLVNNEAFIKKWLASLANKVIIKKTTLYDSTKRNGVATFFFGWLELPVGKPLISWLVRDLVPGPSWNIGAQLNTQYYKLLWFAHVPTANLWILLLLVGYHLNHWQGRNRCRSELQIADAKEKFKNLCHSTAWSDAGPSTVKIAEILFLIHSVNICELQAPILNPNLFLD